MIGAYITFAVAVGIVLAYVAVLRHYIGAEEAETKTQSRPASRNENGVPSDAQRNALVAH